MLSPEKNPVTEQTAAKNTVDDVEEVQLADHFQRILQEHGLDEEHTPQELRFQQIASAPVTAATAAAARNDQVAG